MTDHTSLQSEIDAARDRVRRLEAVVETSFLVNSTLDLRELAAHIIAIATRMVGAERGSLFLVQGESLRSLVADGLSEGELTLKIGDGIVGAVAATGEAVILNLPYEDSRFDPSVDRATGFRTRSLLTVPVRDRDGVLTAVLQLLNHHSDDFSEDDVAFLAELGVPFAIGLTTARLHQEIVARERLREEMRFAAEIQRALQPRADARPPGLDLATLLRPRLEVCGDFFDLIPTDDEDRWWLVVADISGKGVAAGLIAANVQAYLWSRRRSGDPISRVVEEGNDLLYGLAQGQKFATMVLAQWQASTRTLSWVSAGHPPIFLCRAGRVEDLAATGRPIGLLPSQTYEQGERQLEAGDYFVIYTDGVIEAGIGSDKGELDVDGVRDHVGGGGSADEVVEAVDAAVQAHLAGEEPDDDVTVLCAKVL